MSPVNMCLIISSVTAHFEISLKSSCLIGIEIYCQCEISFEKYLKHKKSGMGNLSCDNKGHEIIKIIFY